MIMGSLMMKEGNGQTNKLHAINWGELNHALKGMLLLCVCGQWCVY